MAHPPLPAPGATRPGFPPRGRGRGSSAEGGARGGAGGGGRTRRGQSRPSAGLSNSPGLPGKGRAAPRPGGPAAAALRLLPSGRGGGEGRRGRGAAIAGLPN